MLAYFQLTVEMRDFGLMTEARRQLRAVVSPMVATVAGGLVATTPTDDSDFVAWDDYVDDVLDGVRLLLGVVP